MPAELEAVSAKHFALVFVGGVLAAIFVYMLDFIVNPVETSVFRRAA